jgi:hypothetical protein
VLLFAEPLESLTLPELKLNRTPRDRHKQQEEKNLGRA